jgi:hypothetical protein
MNAANIRCIALEPNRGVGVATVSGVGGASAGTDSAKES